MYRQVKTEFWTDPKIKTLSPRDKTLMLYFITSPRSHFSGIYYLPLIDIENETGIKKANIRSGIDTLSICDLVQYNYDFEIIWVCKMLQHQANSENEKILKNVETHLKTLHKCPLIKDFLNFYDTLSIPYRYPIDTLSIPYRYPP